MAPNLAAHDGRTIAESAIHSGTCYLLKYLAVFMRSLFRGGSPPAFERTARTRISTKQKMDLGFILNPAVDPVPRAEIPPREVRELSTAQPSAGARRGPNRDARKKNAHGNSAGPRRHRRRPAASKPPRPPSVKSPFRKLIISAVQAVDPFFSDKENGPRAGGGRPQRQRFIMDIVLDYCLWDHANTVLTADSDVYGASDNRPSAIPVRRFYDFIDPEDLDEYWYDQRTIWGGLRPVSPIFTSTHVSAERSTAAWTPRLDSDVAPDNEFLRWSGDTPSSASGSSPAAQASWP